MFSNREAYACVLYFSERWSEAEAHFRELAAELPELHVAPSYLGTLAARRGDVEEAQRMADHLLRIEREQPHRAREVRFYRARIAAVRGEREETMRLLAGAADTLRFLHVDPAFDSLRADPEYPGAAAAPGLTVVRVTGSGRSLAWDELLSPPLPMATFTTYLGARAAAPLIPSPDLSPRSQDRKCRTGPSRSSR